MNYYDEMVKMAYEDILDSFSKSALFAPEEDEAVVNGKIVRSKRREALRAKPKTKLGQALQEYTDSAKRGTLPSYTMPTDLFGSPITGTGGRPILRRNNNI